MALSTDNTAPENLDSMTKILVIDDEISIRLTLSKILTKAGYIVEQAESGKAGLNCITKFDPDLVLLDVVMPEMDGYDTCKAIRSLPKNNQLPVLMLTGLDDVNAIDRAFSEGATDFITKPINWPLLVRRVRYALRASEMTKKLHTANLRQSQAQTIAKLGFWEWNKKANLLTWSPELLALFGLPPSPNQGTIEDYLALIPEREKQDVFNLLSSVNPETKQTVSLQHQIVMPNQTYMVRVYASKNENNLVLGVMQDITEIHEAEVQLEYQHYHDLLTTLPNRRMFTEQLTKTVKNSAATVISIDIDRFHLINDTFGSVEGDKILQIAASRINGAMEGQGLVARMASDEFCILLTAEMDYDTISSFVRSIQQTLNKPCQIKEQDIHIETSAGIALAPQDGQDAETLINAAKRARFTSKALSSNRFAFYDSSKETDHSQRFYLENELRNALKLDQFVLFYQPQIDLKTDKIIGVEALIRWQHPDMGLVPPIKFIPLVEEMELIHDVGDWIYQEALNQAKAWFDESMNIRVGINLSAKQFIKPELVANLHRALRESGLPAEYFDLEITESMAMQNPQAALNTLNQFKELGMTLAIDDFGTGYSSLEYLQRFPVDFVKIDRAFIKDMLTNKADQSIVKAIIAIANSLDLKVIAEGVEQAEEYALLQTMGCDEVQGYYISKPLPAPEAYAFIKHYNAK